MTQAQKIVLACFIGGATFVLVALTLPSFWGLLAFPVSFATAWLLCDVREAVTALQLPRRLTALWAWVTEPRPFTYPALIIATALTIPAVYSLLHSDDPVLQKSLFTIPVFGIAVFSVSALLALAGLYTLAQLGAAWAGTFFVREEEGPLMQMKGDKQRQAQGLPYSPPTYLNVAWWILLGLVASAWYCLTKLWADLLFATWAFIKKIHSYQRVLCGIHATLGGLLALTLFALYGPATTQLAQYVVMTLCGGIFGAVSNTLYRNLIAKWLPQLVATSS